MLFRESNFPYKLPTVQLALSMYGAESKEREKRRLKKINKKIVNSTSSRCGIYMRYKSTWIQRYRDGLVSSGFTMASSRETLVAGYGWIALIPNPNVVTATPGYGRPSMAPTFMPTNSFFLFLVSTDCILARSLQHLQLVVLTVNVEVDSGG